MRKITYIGLLLLGLRMSGAAQQNIQFSQYIFNELSVNPAYAGNKEDWYVNAVYRQQWAGFPGAPRTGSFSVDGLFRGDDNDRRVGIGLQASMDALGPQGAFSLYGSYAYRIPMDYDGTSRLCLGIGLGVTQYRIDGATFEYADENDPAIPVAAAASIAPDARFGLYYYSSGFYLGLSVMDLLSSYSNMSYSWKGYKFETIKKTQHVYLSGGTIFAFSENFKMKPSLMVKTDLKGPISIDFNSFLIVAEKFWVGGSYRTTNNASIMAVFNGPTFRLGYAYDMNMSNLAGAGPSHEISLGILFPSGRNDDADPRYF
ncbi:PorP/SprF family type IX secretion system membrane protein [Chitinophaga japonensis]|uniref:Type IX secretion system PorP/SprF family membrane protein n=1 Tax=Chitinophaga japonensis TaxID=104662 RepID=A0A562SRX3_CHIJA|nr:type IX secretion system membrane protein PorP/SprF [Chitinophaga japonensis]TWI83991.1 type IX secretion system PorP/SprF family membrane protein [Chitinophaga japonensis]